MLKKQQPSFWQIKTSMSNFFSFYSGETFSENFSHTERCQPCTQCTDLFRMETPCTDSTDAICVCNYGYYLDTSTQKCEPCTKCPEGQGMLFRCEDDRDTGCENCTGDTYSDQESSWNPCIPCSTCDDETELKSCTPYTDTVCLGKKSSSCFLFKAHRIKGYMHALSKIRSTTHSGTVLVLLRTIH